MTSSVTNTRDFVNSKISCPVCSLLFARNYIKVHLNKQHSNIYNTADWEESRYADNYEKIKKAHKIKWGIT